VAEVPASVTMRILRFSSCSKRREVIIVGLAITQVHGRQGGKSRKYIGSVAPLVLDLVVYDHVLVAYAVGDVKSGEETASSSPHSSTSGRGDTSSEW
jgi:hypothetical protein